MKRKASSMLLVAVFLAVLFFPHILWNIFSDQIAGENSEKRTLAERPAFSLTEIEAYPKAYEEYYDDHLPFRDWMIKLYNSLQVRLFRTSSSRDVILGKEGWLFYSSQTDGTSLQCYDGSLLFTDEELAHIADNLSGIQEKLAEQGTEFVVFIAPSKERIYSEYMPDYLGEPAEMCMVSQIMDYLHVHTNIRLVYPYEELVAYKEAHPQQLLYYRTDTHWNDLGAYVGTKALLAELGIESVPLAQVDMTEKKNSKYDLASLLNVWGIHEDGVAKVVSAAGNEPKTLSYDYYGRSEYEMEGAPAFSLFMHNDSFGAEMAKHLKYNLSHTLLMHHTEYKPEQIWAEKPDVFVLEVAERYIRRLRNPIL